MYLPLFSRRFIHCAQHDPVNGAQALSIARSSNAAKSSLMKRLPVAMACVLLISCAQQSPSPVASEPLGEAQVNAKTKVQEAAEETEREGEPAVSQRHFAIDTLYTLLVAEIAGNRKHYDLALTNYYHQAKRTQDAGIAARATHIARYLNARRAALDSAKLWVELEPTNPKAQLAVTAELTLAGDIDNALRHADRALALGSDAPLQSIAATAAPNAAMAQTVTPKFRRLYQQYPQNHAAALALAIVLRANQSYQEALAITRRVQKQQPDLLDAPLLLSHLLIDLERRDEARKLLENLVAVYPQESRLRLQYARLLIREDLTLARQQFAKLVKQRPEDGNMILSLALIQFETDNFHAAKPLFERLLELEQHESAANYRLGSIAEQAEQTAQAIAYYRQVGPGGDYVQAITCGTELLLVSSDSQAVGAWFDELRERHPGQVEQFYLLEAELLNGHALHQEAQLLLGSAVGKHSGSQRLIYAHAMASKQVGNSAAFETGLRKLLAQDPDNANLLNTLGYSLIGDGQRLEEALQLISKALQLSPDDPAIIDSMGWVQYHLGNHNEAVKYLQKAMQQLPNHEIAAHLGEALWAQGQHQQAMAVWQQGLAINPDSKIISEAMQRLQNKQNLEQHVSEN